MRRNSIGVDILPEYYKMVNKKLKPVTLFLMEDPDRYEKQDT
jgi:DNA modification methylase